MGIENMNGEDNKFILSQENNEKIEKYIDVINGQIREPTASIFACLPLLAESINDHKNEKSMKTLQIIYKKVYTILKSVNNVTLATKLSSNVSIPTQVVDFSVLVDSAFSSSKIVLPNYCTVDVNIQDGIIVTGNSMLLSIGLFNLILNSLDYRVEDDVKISVTLKKEKNRCTLIYRDNSIGVKDEFMNDIFKPYFSVNPYGDDVSENMGLGLFILDSAVKHAKGTIFFQSEFSKGVNIVISIPESDIDKSNVVKSQPKNFMLNKYSDMFVQLSKYCTLPDLI